MDQITDEEAKPIADRIINGSKDTKVNTDWFLNDIKYYLAAKKMMEFYVWKQKLTGQHLTRCQTVLLLSNGMKMHIGQLQ